MRDVPIYIRVDVEGRISDIALVGDPSDSMLATNIGRGVASAILESADWLEHAPPYMGAEERNSTGPAPRPVAPPVEKPSETDA